MSTELVLQPPPALPANSQALADYVSPEAHALVLQTDEDLQLATDIINDIKARVEAMEAVRTAVTQPINQGLRTYNALFKPFQESAAAARKLWDDKIRAFYEAREKATRAAEAALQQAIVTQDAYQATAAIQAIQPAARAKGLVLQDAWDFEVRNHDIVPTSCTTVDRQKVLAEIRRQLAEGATEPAIAGLKVFKKQIVKAAG